MTGGPGPNADPTLPLDEADASGDDRAAELVSVLLSDASGAGALERMRSINACACCSRALTRSAPVLAAESVVGVGGTIVGVSSGRRLYERARVGEIVGSSCVVIPPDCRRARIRSRTADRGSVVGGTRRLRS